MVYHIVNIVVYIISIVLAMIRFDQYIRKGKEREFHIFFIVTSIALGYLFASFVLSFGSLSFQF